MPYIITTMPREWRDYAAQHGTDDAVQRGGMNPVTRRAVATLDMETLKQEAKRAQSAMIFGVERIAQIERAVETGGTIGPLPDGTVIEVALVAWDELASRAGIYLREYLRIGNPRPSEQQRVINAYNAAQD